MARNRSAAFAKRTRERAREERRKEKAEKRSQRQQDKDGEVSVGPGEDPDLAGIVPGPQPLPDEAAD